MKYGIGYAYLGIGNGMKYGMSYIYIGVVNGVHTCWTMNTIKSLNTHYYINTTETDYFEITVL